MKLKPYTGAHAGNLYHVVDDEGLVIRNASVLEVKLWGECEALRQTLAALRGKVEGYADLMDQLDVHIHPNIELDAVACDMREAAKAES
ncbi:MAG: hypothetical protein WBH20_15945 [Oceanisphaera sp.]|uniref:hypothetical protein n=1 Tax=Oceanisphaera sp. TaxID=1929979 RepID=UPI003C7339C8